MTGREALLLAFDDLFEAALARLHATCTPEERSEARARFQEHFRAVLDLGATIEVPEVPQAALAEMRSALAQLSPAALAGVMASIPIAQQTQAIVRRIARARAEQRMLEHLASQADTRWGN
jgi:hypothetical protein